MSLSTEDQLRFANDADAMFSSSSGIDPRINAWDLSSDVFQYSSDRVQFCQNAMANLMDRMVDDGESYHEFRRGFFRLMWDQASGLSAVVRYVGGVEIDRNLHGQKENGQPHTPVSYQQQKKAVEMMSKYAFSPNSFSVSRDNYAHLQPQRRGWDFWSGTEDPKILQQIGSFQRMLLSHIMHPNTLSRMNNSRRYGNSYSVIVMLRDVTSGIFDSDLGGAVNPLRQNLQQSYVDGLIAGLKSVSYDAITKSALFYQLESIQTKLEKKKGKQMETKAHRAYMMHKIDEALDADS